MAPTTRASLAPTTPQKSNSKKPSPSPEGRKSPRCQTCKQPRKGHPRQGCPNAPPADEAQDAPAPDARLADALGSLHIEPEATIISAPAAGTSTAVKDPFAKAKIRREQGRIMPGTFLPPTNSLLVTEPPSLPSSQRTEIWHPDELDEDSKVLSQPSSLAQQPTANSSRSLVRSASMNAREDFLEDLDRVATRVPVSVYIVPVDDVEQLQKSAREVGFLTATVISEKGARKDEALLVIGTEDTAVGDVRERLVKEHTAAKRSGRKSYGLAQVAGGVMVGAAAVFAGLATM
ncbi:hypothetical protein PENSPDRAFT_646560 [Peniophora sp. CONT]|nr:hypothetical protein PENSPDRAFT_646560 [Peniophora sp. CONT]